MVIVEGRTVGLPRKEIRGRKETRMDGEARAEAKSLLESKTNGGSKRMRVVIIREPVSSVFPFTEEAFLSIPIPERARHAAQSAAHIWGLGTKIKE